MALAVKSAALTNFVTPSRRRQRRAFQARIRYLIEDSEVWFTIEGRILEGRANSAARLAMNLICEREEIPTERRRKIAFFEFKTHRGHRSVKAGWCTIDRIEIPEGNYVSYRETAIADLHSAEQDLHETNTRWAIVKAYNAFTLVCTALLVKYRGRYVKDADGLFTALRQEKLISEKTWSRIQAELKITGTFEELVEEVRLLRNKALYYPSTQSKIANADAQHLVETVRQVILIVGEDL